MKRLFDRPVCHFFKLVNMKGKRKFWFTNRRGSAWVSVIVEVMMVVDK